MKGCLQGPSPLEGLALRSSSPPAPHLLPSPLLKQSPLGGGQPSCARAAHILIPQPQMELACRATLWCWWPVSPPLSKTSQEMTDTSDKEPFTASCSTAHPRPQPFGTPLRGSRQSPGAPRVLIVMQEGSRSLGCRWAS